MQLATTLKVQKKRERENLFLEIAKFDWDSLNDIMKPGRRDNEVTKLPSPEKVRADLEKWAQESKNKKIKKGNKNSHHGKFR